MTSFRAVVLEHFRHPRNRGPLDDANAFADGANPLCGDRIRIQLRLTDDIVREARFTADACAICVASASLLTEYAAGKHRDEVAAIDVNWLNAALDGAPPAARAKCASLALETLQRAAAAFARDGS